MSEEKYNQRFEMPNGAVLQIHDSYKGQYFAACIQRKFPDGHKDDELEVKYGD